MNEDNTNRLPAAANVKKPKAQVAQPAHPDFLTVVELLEVLSQASLGLTEIEASANSELLALVAEFKADYARFQLAATEAETRLEELCRKHPEWFGVKKSITTPYGKVAFRESTKLVLASEEATVKLLLAEAERSQAQRAVDGTSELFVANRYLKTVQVPNLEALEGLADHELARFMVRREREDSFKATPAKVDFGKAVTEAAQQN